MKNEFNQRHETNGVCNEYIGYEIYGMEYMLPSAPKYPQYRFKKITVEVGSSSCLDSEISKFEHLILPVDMTLRQLRVTVHCVDRRRLFEGEDPVKVALYRTDCPTALFCHEVEPSTPEYSFGLNYSKVQPGEYYLYVANAEPPTGLFGFRRFGNGYAYRFKVLEHGSRLNMPSIRSVGHFIIPGLQVCFNEPINPQENWLSCEYYDEDYRMVATPAWLEISSDGLFANLGVRPVGHWLPSGIYHILLYHNNQPMAQFRFEWSDDHSSEIKQEPMKDEKLTSL